MRHVPPVYPYAAVLKMVERQSSHGVRRDVLFLLEVYQGLCGKTNERMLPTHHKLRHVVETWISQQDSTCDSSVQTKVFNENT